MSKSKPKKKKKGKHPVGRPPLFKTAREMQEKIDDYFESCWVDKVVEVTDKEGNVTATNSRYQNRSYTVMGLCLALGFTCREQLRDYKAKPEFTDTIKRARSKIEMNIEEQLIEGKNAAGPIFWLKNNAEEKYKDKHELEHTGKDGEPLQGTTIVLTPMERAARVAFVIHQGMGLQKPEPVKLADDGKKQN